MKTSATFVLVSLLLLQGNGLAQLPEPTFVTHWGELGSDAGQFFSPSDAALDPGGNLYVVEVGNHRVQKFSSDGLFLTRWGLGDGDGLLFRPTSVAVDQDGFVYVSDSSRRIQKLDPNGNFVISWGDFSLFPDDFILTWGRFVLEAGQFFDPEAVIVSTTGEVFIVDDGNHRIQKFSFGFELHVRTATWTELKAVYR